MGCMHFGPLPPQHSVPGLWPLLAGDADGNGRTEEVEVGEVLLDFADDAFGGQVEAIAPEGLRAVVYELVGESDAGDFRFFEVLVLVEELEHGVSEAAGDGTLLN